MFLFFGKKIEYFWISILFKLSLKMSAYWSSCGAPTQTRMSNFIGEKKKKKLPNCQNNLFFFPINKSNTSIWNNSNQFQWFWIHNWKCTNLIWRFCHHCENLKFKQVYLRLSSLYYNLKRTIQIAKIEKWFAKMENFFLWFSNKKGQENFFSHFQRKSMNLDLNMTNLIDGIVWSNGNDLFRHQIIYGVKIMAHFLFVCSFK